MSRPSASGLVRALVFGVLLLASAAVREGPSTVINQAIVWLPTGVAMSGLCLLGLRAWWVVAITTLVQRLLIGYDLSVAVPAAAGSTAEALLGVWLLGRLGFRPAIDRLRDVVALLVAAAVAPIGSIAFSWIGRSFVWSDSSMPFYSGWGGWWRMNALGALAVVPVALTWLTIPRRERTARLATTLGLAIVGIPLVFAFAMRVVPGGASGVMWLELVFGLLVLGAAGRFGMRGISLASTLAMLTVALLSVRGHGPFVAVQPGQRHEVLQLVALMFVAIPPAFGALVAERRAAQDRGTRSDELRRTIQLASLDATYRLRRDGTCLEVSFPPGSGEAAFHDPTGRSVFDVLSPEQGHAIRRGVSGALGRGRPATVEYDIEVDGRHRVREARCLPHGDDEVIAVVRDITDRKRSEGMTAFEARVLGLVATGRPNAEVFAAIVSGIEALTPGVRCSIIVLEGTIMRVATAPSLPAEYNAAVDGREARIGMGSCGTAVATNRTVIVRDIATDPHWERYRAFAMSHGLRACWSVPVRDSAGAVLGTFAVYDGEPREPGPQDLALAERAATLAAIVLEREARAAALRRSEDLLATIHRNVQEGLFRADPELNVVYASPAFARLFGQEDPQWFVGRSFAGALEEPGRLGELVRAAREGGSWRNEEARFLRADGSAFWGMLSGAAVRGEDGAITHYDGAIADVTLRKELEDQFRQSQKMEAVGKLAGGVAHDFNNLLTVIVGYAEAIRDEARTAPRLGGYAGYVLDAAERAAGLTRQLLAYSRQQMLSPRVLELNDVVGHMGEMLQRLIGEDMRLVVELAPEPCWVRVDPSQIEQVLLNLVVNARDAMAGGGSLTIRTAGTTFGAEDVRSHPDLEAGAGVLLCVRDTGVGMSPEVRARAFDPFFTTKGPGRGTGLGLSTVYGIVKQSGGAVWLTSTPGAGTEVWIALPRCEDPERFASPAAMAASEPRTGTVLVVEDEPAVRALVCRLLERSGCTVLEADDGRRALDVAAGFEGPLDLVVSDVVMPNMSGPEMADRLLRVRPGLRFLFISGYPDDARSPHDLPGGGGAFLPKPFTPEQLLEQARTLLAAGPG